MASPSSSSNEVPTGTLDPSSTWGEFNNIMFAVQQALSKMQTATLVRIESCTNAGELTPVGYVDVTPLVNQLDGAGNPTPHETIYNVPYFRLQGGANGIIMDPVKGDVGICVFASRDISKIKTTKKQGNPGSRRQYSFSDGMYLGGMLNGRPPQYVQFSAAGIRIHSPTLVKLDAPDIQLSADTVEIVGTTSTTITTPTFTVNGAAQFNGTIDATGEVTGNGIALSTHAHSGVTPGGSNTGGPV
jgi:hypothetical protein